MSSTWEPPDPTTRHEGDLAPPRRGRLLRRWHLAPRHATYRGRHDTRLVVGLTIAGTIFTFAVSDASQDITIQDLREAGERP